MEQFTSLRHYAFLILVAVFMFPAMTSCSNYEEDKFIWDINPIEVFITINDANGNNLLNPQITGTLFGKGIIAEFNGNPLETQWEDSYNLNSESRTYLPTFYGFTLREGIKVEENKSIPDPTKNRMMFGELDGTKNQDVSLKIKIEGYTETWEIKIDHRIEWIKRNPKITHVATLNGKEVDERNIVITIP